MSVRSLGPVVAGGPIAWARRSPRSGAERYNVHVTRAPRSVAGYIWVGLVRGVVAGFVCGVVVPVTIATLLADEGTFDSLLWLVAVGSLCGLGLGISFGLVVGLIVGLLRFRFYRLGRVAAAATFAITFAIGGVLTAIHADRWQHLVMFGSWSFAVAFLLAGIAAIAARGVTGEIGRAHV